MVTRKGERDSSSLEVVNPLILTKFSELYVNKIVSQIQIGRRTEINDRLLDVGIDLDSISGTDYEAFIKGANILVTNRLLTEINSQNESFKDTENFLFDETKKLIIDNIFNCLVTANNEFYYWNPQIKGSKIIESENFSQNHDLSDQQNENLRQNLDSIIGKHFHDSANQIKKRFVEFLEAENNQTEGVQRMYSNVFMPDKIFWVLQKYTPSMLLNEKLEVDDLVDPEEDLNYWEQEWADNDAMYFENDNWRLEILLANTLNQFSKVERKDKIQYLVKDNQNNKNISNLRNLQDFLRKEESNVDINIEDKIPSISSDVVICLNNIYEIVSGSSNDIEDIFRSLLDNFFSTKKIDNNLLNLGIKGMITDYYSGKSKQNSDKLELDFLEEIMSLIELFERLESQISGNTSMKLRAGYAHKIFDESGDFHIDQPQDYILKLIDTYSESLKIKVDKYQLIYQEYQDKKEEALRARINQVSDRIASNFLINLKDIDRIVISYTAERKGLLGRSKNQEINIDIKELLKDDNVFSKLKEKIKSNVNINLLDQIRDGNEDITTLTNEFLLSGYGSESSIRRDNNTDVNISQFLGLEDVDFLLINHLENNTNSYIRKKKNKDGSDINLKDVDNDELLRICVGIDKKDPGNMEFSNIIIDLINESKPTEPVGTRINELKLELDELETEIIDKKNQLRILNVLNKEELVGGEQLSRLAILESLFIDNNEISLNDKDLSYLLDYVITGEKNKLEEYFLRIKSRIDSLHMDESQQVHIDSTQLAGYITTIKESKRRFWQDFFEKKIKLRYQKNEKSLYEIMEGLLDIN